jgi:hypothetical protein
LHFPYIQSIQADELICVNQGSKISALQAEDWQFEPIYPLKIKSPDKKYRGFIFLAINFCSTNQNLQVIIKIQLYP